jgi:hypothetical protein
MESPAAKVSPNKIKQIGSMRRGKMHMTKRELIDTGSDTRDVRRDETRQFEQSHYVGKSLSQDVRKSAKITAKAGHGDRGDQKR